jgi:hypothetical protein
MTPTGLPGASELRGASWTAAGSAAPRRFRTGNGVQKLAARACVRTAWNVYWPGKTNVLISNWVVDCERLTAFGFTDTPVSLYDPAIGE